MIVLFAASAAAIAFLGYNMWKEDKVSDVHAGYLVGLPLVAAFCFVGGYLTVPVYRVMVDEYKELAKKMAKSKKELERKREGSDGGDA